MAKELTFNGKTEEEMKNISLEEFSKMVTARQRRNLKRGFTDQQKKLLVKIKKFKEGKIKKQIKTHLRDMIIIPEMLGLKLLVHSGKTFVPVVITIEMLGHYFGEFVQTRSKVSHSAPGIGATRSSASASVK